MAGILFSVLLGAAYILIRLSIPADPVDGGTSQTAVNDQAGARSQIAQVVTVGAAVVTLLFLAPLIGMMPKATLGALVLVAAAGLIKGAEFSKIARFRKIELVWALVAFAGVVVMGTLQGIAVAVMISIAVLITLPTTFRCMSSVASGAPTCSAHWRIIPTMRPFPAC